MELSMITQHDRGHKAKARVTALELLINIRQYVNQFTHTEFEYTGP